jgi:hypothetical protein
MYEIFFVSCLFLLLSCHIYGLHKNEINNVKKKQKNFILQSFSEHLRADRFIGFCTGLLVVPIGKPVKLTDFIFSNSKIEFGPVFTVTGHTGDDQFQSLTRRDSILSSFFLFEITFELPFETGQNWVRQLFGP